MNPPAEHQTVCFQISVQYVYILSIISVWFLCGSSNIGTVHCGNKIGRWIVFFQVFLSLMPSIYGGSLYLITW